MTDFRILSLDGGGAWALIQVMTLIDLYGENALGHDVLKRFDLITANSGGSIVLGGLVKNMKLSALRDLFADPNLNQREKIFVKTSFFTDPLSHLTQLAGIGPKYDTQAKLVGLKGVLGPDGERLVTDLPDWIGPGIRGRKPQFVFCTFQYDLNREIFFRSDGASMAGSFGPHAQVTVVQAIHASTNAPVNYFDAPAKIGGARYWDGAIGGYNNPVAAAVIEAVANLERYDTAPGEIKALSLGTASVVLPLEKHVPHEDPDLVQHQDEASLTGDLRKLATSIVDDPPDAASFHAHILLGGPLPADADHPVTTGPVVRMSPLVQPVPGTSGGPWDLPAGLTRDEFSRLRNLDSDAIKQNDVDLIRSLAEAWLTDKVLNQPIRPNSGTLMVEIGHRWYSEAKAQAERF